MPLLRYGVLAGRIAARRLDLTEQASHYHVRVVAGGQHFRVAVGVRSRAYPSALLYLIDDDFRHPLTARLGGLRDGFLPLPSEPGGLALDFIRAPLFDRRAMRPLPANIPGPGNDLDEHIDRHVRRALDGVDARLFAFGERWGPERRADRVFRFRPGDGLHDLHMNQGNAPQFRDDDGVWQDGALFLHSRAEERWTAIFLAFQSQSWQTDDRTGHARRRAR